MHFALSLLGAILGWMFGQLDGFMYALIVFVATDYITGVMAAAVEKRLSSEVGFKGICRKITIYKAARILKNNKNYIAISDLEQAGFAIGYDEKTKIPSITNEPKELHLTVDGKETSVEAVNINGSNYIPIRSLAATTGKFDVDFKDGKVIVTTK